MSDATEFEARKAQRIERTISKLPDRSDADLIRSHMSDIYGEIHHKIGSGTVSDDDLKGWNRYLHEALAWEACRRHEDACDHIMQAHDLVEEDPKRRESFNRQVASLDTETSYLEGVEQAARLLADRLAEMLAERIAHNRAA